MIFASSTETVLAPETSWPTRVAWGAVIAGCVLALSVHLLLTMLGLALGVAVVNPRTGETDLPQISAAAGIAWSVSALIALWLGGWLAGRTAREGVGRVGLIHGLLVWAVATVVMFVFVSGGTGLLMGGALKAVGRGAGMATQVAAANGTTPASPAPGTPAALLDSFLEEAGVAPAPGTTGADAADTARARREIGTAVAQYFRERNPANREALVAALASGNGRNRENAETTVRSWEDAYMRATQRAEAAANVAARKLAVAGAWTFAAFVLGGIAAAAGGRAGARASARLRTADVAPA